MVAILSLLSSISSVVRIILMPSDLLCTNTLSKKMIETTSLTTVINLMYIN
jgi:hypothetical protein